MREAMLGLSAADGARLVAKYAPHALGGEAAAAAAAAAEAGAAGGEHVLGDGEVTGACTHVRAPYRPSSPCVAPRYTTGRLLLQL